MQLQIPTEIIAISEQTKRDAVQYLNADPNKITVVYQGCNEAYKKEYMTRILRMKSEKNMPCPKNLY